MSDPGTTVRACVDVRATPTSAAEARRALSDLRDRIPGYDDVTLLVTELVTNATRHAGLAAGDVITISISSSGEHVLVEVDDPGRGFTHPRPAPDGESGYGLRLVEQLTERWGVRRDRGHTVVWFDYARAG